MPLPSCGGSPVPMESHSSTHLLRAASPQGPRSAPYSSGAVLPAPGTCLWRLVKSSAVTFLWVCLFSSCPVPASLFSKALGVGPRLGRGGSKVSPSPSQPGVGLRPHRALKQASHFPSCCVFAKDDLTPTKGMPWMVTAALVPFCSGAVGGGRVEGGIA